MRHKRSDRSYSRKKKSIKPSPFFIIVCEGSVTEVDYFKSFPYYRQLGKRTGYQSYQHESIRIDGGAGQHEKVVAKASKVFREFNDMYGGISPSEVWCVFDCDNNPTELQKAVTSARKKGFNPIYSVQCFELWFLLHFQVLTTAIPKSDYDKKISQYLGINYSHGTTGLFSKLEGQPQQHALKVAADLWERRLDENQLFEDPLTNVFLLVNELNLAFNNIKNK